MEEPLLFIQTPPFYYVEEEVTENETVIVAERVEDEQVVEEPQQFLEESTSVYELSRTERIKDPVIARQLNYFLQPVNQQRLLTFYLLNGNEETGKIIELNGLQVKIRNNNEELFINANEIKAITTKKG